MALVRADVMFGLYPAKFVHQQQVKLRPNEHHYESEGEEPYIKYTCQICEQLAKNVKGLPLYSDDEEDEDVKFTSFSFPKGTEKCPCCGINLEWNYKTGITS